MKRIMKYWWILVLLALALIVWRIRERFEATPSIKAPPYDAAEKVRIFDMVRQRASKPPYTFLGFQDMLMAKAKAQAPTETNETKLKEIGGGLISPAIESFFTSVYKPATTPIKQEDIDKFMETRMSDMKDVEKDVLTTYFIGQSGAGSSAYSAILSDMGQSGFGYAQQGTASMNERAVVGGAPPQMATSQETSSEEYATPTCPSGYTLRVTPSSNTCVRTTAATTSGSGMSQNTTVSTTTGTTTGGSSTSSFGPNSGGGGNRRNQVFGPLSGGRGEGSGFVPSDSSKTNQYPEIMGGGDNKPSTRIDGGGIVAPSKNWQLAMDGSLPDCKSLGCDENSRYLPYSRQPGDMDLIPDPYRVSQQFSTASYSFKTEPSPFLTDFSAFLK